MHWRRSLFLALAVGVGVTPLAPANDLCKIERRIGKEPKYHSEKPQYCLLVFGAKADALAWLARDGDALCIDRNGNGDLTERGERFTPLRLKEGEAREPFLAKDNVAFRSGPLTLTPGGDKRAYSGLLAVFERKEVLLLEGPDWPQVVGGFGLKFSDRAGSAPIVHFDGPLTLTLPELQGSPAAHALSPGTKRDVGVLIGTPGLGLGTFASRPVQRLTINSFIKARKDAEFGEPAPDEISPTVEISFPSRPGG